MICLVSPEYFCNLDSNQLRLDQLQRPELTKGTVDFTVPQSYYASHSPPKLSLPYYSVEPPPQGTREPVPMDYVFAFDVGRENVVNGLISEACKTLRGILYGGMEDESGQEVEACWPGSGRIAIITFDGTLHFYNLSVCIIPFDR
jgi:protein transport protein SEC24